MKLRLSSTSEFVLFIDSFLMQFKPKSPFSRGIKIASDHAQTVPLLRAITAGVKQCNQPYQGLHYKPSVGYLFRARWLTMSAVHLP